MKINLLHDEDRDYCKSYSEHSRETKFMFIVKNNENILFEKRNHLLMIFNSKKTTQNRID